MPGNRVHASTTSAYSYMTLSGTSMARGVPLIAQNTNLPNSKRNQAG